MIEGLMDGTIDAIATDHAPHHRDEKEVEFDKALNGIVGLETSLPLGITHLVRPGKLTLSQLIEKMSTVPAKIIGIDRGSLQQGKIADLVLFDPEEKYIIHGDDFASKGRNTPFDGHEVYGKVLMTISEGKVVYTAACR